MSQTLSYRFARGAEIPDLARLAAHSFPGGGRTVAWWEEQLRAPVYGGGAETVLLGETAAGEPAALCQIHPLRQWVGGEALPVAGVGTVTVSPAYRRRGLGVALMTAALRWARERGDVASALYPFRTAFYRKLGYGHAGDAVQYQVAAQTLPDAPERAGVELLEEPAERAAALELYNRWAKGQTGQLLRGERLWTLLCTLPDRVLVGYRGGGGELEGYALAVYRTDLAPPQRFLEVEELAWTTAAARRALYAWVGSMGDQWAQVLLRALPSQRLGDWISEPRLPHWSAPGWGLWVPSATLLAGPMFRIVDMAAAWSRRRVAAGTSLTIGVDVTDAQLPENGGAWRLVLEGGGITAERGGAADCTLRLDISTLSRLYIGSLTATAALAAGLLEAGGSALCEVDEALALPEAWTFDRF
jgi:predicted acetyltransferase